MWICHKCGKPVFFAERRQSIGFDWHPYCLKCTECNKVLNPGQHAEHKSAPYCHIPCYSALFGPKLFGHGSTTESHRSFGRRSQSFIRLETELSNRLKEYNRYYTETPRCQLLSREVNERLVLEGVLKVYWGTECSIQLKEYGDNRVINRHKKTLSLGFELCGGVSGNDEDEISLFFPPQLGDLSFDLGGGGGDTPNSLTHSDLQKWQTSTTLDREGTEKLDVQLLESLIDDKPIKSLSRSRLAVERSQSVRIDPDTKLTLHKPKSAARKSCNLNQLSSDEVTGSKAKFLDMLAQLSPNKQTADNDNIHLDYSSPPSAHSTLKKPIHDTTSTDLNCDITNASTSTSSPPTPFTTLTTTLSSSTTTADEEPNGNTSQIFEKDNEITTNIVNHEINGNVEQAYSDENDENNENDIKISVSKDPSANSESFDVIGEDKENLDNVVVMRKKRRGKPAALQTSSSSSPDFKLGQSCQSLLPSKAEITSSSSPRHSLPVYMLSKDKEVEEYRKGPRALKRRRGKMTRVRRRSSVNGHWFDRETSVFTPPKDSGMSVWTTSLQTSQEVLASLLNKYKIESEAADFGLYVVKESGERRLLMDQEHPLLLRVNLGPHEDIAKIYLMNKANTNEISHRVAEYLRFSYAELRSFLSIFYDEEEREADIIRYKYHALKEMIAARLEQIKPNTAETVQS